VREAGDVIATLPYAGPAALYVRAP
jgi:hypothetical protein